MDERRTHTDENDRAGYIDWLRGEGEKPTQQVLDHVANCETCKREILELAEVLDQIDQVDVKNKKVISLRLVIRSAAALVAVMLVALAIDFLKKDEQEPVLTMQQTGAGEPVTDSLPEGVDRVVDDPPAKEQAVEIIAHDTIRFADNFIPNPELETLIHSRFRSATEQPVDIAPDTICLAGSVLRLNRPDEMHEDMVFTLMDNTSATLVSDQLKHLKNGIILSCDPGLYYWKLSDDEGLVSTGRFTVYSSLNGT